MAMRLFRSPLATTIALSTCLAACSSTTGAGPAVLLVENFNEENGGTYALNYTDFDQWTVSQGSVDLIGTPPYDDFLPAAQGLYVDLDGTSKAAGTLESRELFELPRGPYELVFKLAGTPREFQPSNTVVVSLGDVFQESITLPSHAPLETYTRSVTVSRRTTGRLRFEHLGGDDYGIMVDDVQLRRL